jgi:two-component system OmpR family sensor kinase
MWFVAVLAVLLVTFSGGLYALLRKSFYDKTDLLLKSVCSATLSVLREDSSGVDEVAARNAMNALRFPDYSLAIFDAHGHLLAENPVASSEGIELPSDASLQDGAVHLYTIRSVRSDRDLYRMAAVYDILEPGGRTYTVVVGRALVPVLGELEDYRKILTIAVPLCVMLTGLGGWFLARKSLAPVLAMSEKTRRIGAESMEQRLPVANPRNELGQLASTFNNLLSRLSSAFSLQRQFMADASHELRTPVSVIRTATSVTLQMEHRREEEYRSALVIIDEQVTRLARIVEDMFRLARADAGGLTLQEGPFYLDELLGETARAASVLASSKEITVKLSPMTESLFYGDEGLLRQMISNLLDNSLKFTARGGIVTVNLELKNGSYLVSVSDTGPGIQKELQARVFERFFRIEKADPRPNGANSTGAGAGLGLSIARSIAEAHRGSLSLKSSDSTGSTFVAILPVRTSSTENKPVLA